MKDMPVTLLRFSSTRVTLVLCDLNIVSKRDSKRLRMPSKLYEYVNI